MAAPDEVYELVERFDRNHDAYRSSTYNEAQLRQEFLNPLFAALGWDVANTAGYAEQYKDVVHEAALRIEGAPKAPDYSFRVGGVRKFFVEAKKPEVNLKGAIAPAYQLRRYAWSAKLPLSVLTDFEEWAVYDCRVRPQKQDKPSRARVQYLTYDQYVDQWTAIEETFSKEAILLGSFDKYADSNKKKRGTAEVDDEFLREIERWREILARNIALRNPDLSARELNFAVQRTIDRIVFLRISEDRGIENYGRLRAAANGVGIYERLCNLFWHADQKYNSGLFHFEEEPGRVEGVDGLTLDLTIDDKPLRDILSNLYYPESPYAFGILPAEILGHVYERFLGKTIRLTANHRAVVEDKPEVRKAGGVYYTPAFVVDYIVRTTLEPLVAGQTPDDLDRLRILDPACGSGSFLLDVYQYLLDWHLTWYVENRDRYRRKYRDRIRQAPDGSWRLVTAERKRILLNSVFGVDLDAQAVEVSKLSLLLKVLEGETEETLGEQIRLFAERALPDLGDNIKDGNSLVLPDFYDTYQPGLLDPEERLRLNVFDWDREFPSVFRGGGGFDAVVGNPPYVRSQSLPGHLKEYFGRHYTAAKYQPDTFAFFVERGVRLLSQTGRLGFIIPNGILTNTYYGPLRRFLLRETALEVVVDLKDGVFEDAAVDTSIFILRRESKADGALDNEVRIGEWPARASRSVETPTNSIRQGAFLTVPDFAFNTGVDADEMALLDKIAAVGKTFGQLVEVKAGMKVRKTFIDDAAHSESHRPFVVGGDVRPFELKPQGLWVRYERDLEMQYSNQAFRDERIFTAPEKVLVRQVMGDGRIYAALDEDQFYVDQSAYIVLPKSADIPMTFVVAVLSSRLLAFYFSKTLADRKRTFPKVKGAQVKQLPIPDPGDPENAALVERIDQIVRDRLAAGKTLAASRTPHERTANSRHVADLEQRLDRAVYEAFGLTPEEIARIEAPE